MPDLSALALKALRKRFDNAIAGVCYVCGCTDDNECDPPCSWADVDLCSSPFCLQLDDVIREVEPVVVETAAPRELGDDGASDLRDPITDIHDPRESARRETQQAIRTLKEGRAMSDAQLVTAASICLPVDFDDRIAVSDGEAFLAHLKAYGFAPASVKTIWTAVNSGRGVTLAEFLELIMNAAVEQARDALARMNHHLPCNVEPACNLAIGHDGECDIEVPF